MQKILFFLLCILAGAQIAKAQEAYAVYSSSNSYLTFYYDSQKSSRPGKVYSLNAPGEWPAWQQQSQLFTNVRFDASFANYRPTSTRGWFRGMNNLQGDIEGQINLNTSNVTDMSYMFENCPDLPQIGVISSCLNTSKVTDMSCMYSNCGIKYLNLGNFDTSKVTDMHDMFKGCSAIRCIQLSSFNTGSVRNMSGMFSDCNALLVVYAGSGFTTNNVTSSSGMFSNCTNLVGGNGTVFSSSYTDKSRACIDGSNPGYFTANGTKIAYAVLDIWDTSSSLTFYYDTNIMNSSEKYAVFHLAGKANKWYNHRMYIETVVFASSFKDYRIKTCKEMFYGLEKLTQVSGTANFNTSDVTDMSDMFNGCNNLTALSISNFNTAKVTDMSGMFYNCMKLAELNISNFNTANVTDMSSMFYKCNSLTQLNIDNFNTSKVTNMSYMFNGCVSLTELNYGA